jgi:signal transduction histidine kinase
MPRIMVARLIGAAGLRGLMGVALAAPLLAGYILFLLASANHDIVRLIALMLFCSIALLIIVPVAVLVLLRFLFTTQAIVLEGLGVIGALRRSWRLFGTSLGRAIGIVLLMLLLWGALYLAPPVICYVVLQMLFPDPVGSYATRQPIQMLVSYIALILATPFAYIGYTLIYFDLRARAEGYDIELLAQQAALS